MVDLLVPEALHIDRSFILRIRHVGRVRVLEVLPGRRRDLVVIEIDRIQPYRLLTALHSHAVDVPEIRLHVRSQQIVQVLTYQEVHTELLRRSLQPRSHVHVWTEVRCIDLVLRADRALDGPSDVEPESHRNGEIGHAGLEPAVQAVLEHQWVLVYLDEGLHEAKHREIRQDAQVPPVLPLYGVGLVVERVLLLRDLPHQQEGLADVLVRAPAVTVHRFVHQRTDLVHEDQNLLLEHLSHLREVPDIAKAENRAFFLALYHRVHVSLLDYVRADDLGTRAAEDYRQKRTNFDDGITDDSRLQFSIKIQLLLGGRFGVLCHEHQFLHHSLDGLHQQRVDIVRE